MARIHEEEMSELRQFFENKNLEIESSYIEEITNIKESYEIRLG